MLLALSQRLEKGVVDSAVRIYMYSMVAGGLGVRS